MASEQQASNVVTSENLREFQMNRLGIVEVPAETEPADPEAEEVEEHEEAEESQRHKPNPKLQKRFSELTKARDDARAKAADAERKAEEAVARAKALEDKYIPRAENDARPDASQYSDIEKYAADLESWKERDVRRGIEREASEAKAKAQQEARVKSWNDRMQLTVAELPDFADTVQTSPVAVSDHVRDAILESEVGPKILYHLAKNPDTAEKLRGMSVASSLREIGKIEAQLEKSPVKADETPIASMSRAPAPITPVRGGKTTPEAPIDANGEFSGTPAQWRALRKAGKIK